MKLLKLTDLEKATGLTMFDLREAVQLGLLPGDYRLSMTLDQVKTTLGDALGTGAASSAKPAAPDRTASTSWTNLTTAERAEFGGSENAWAAYTRAAARGQIRISGSADEQPAKPAVIHTTNAQPSSEWSKLSAKEQREFMSETSYNAYVRANRAGLVKISNRN